MAKATKATKATATAASIVALATTAPTPAPTPAPVVALRGGAAVATITFTGAKPYRVKAGHNAVWLGVMQSLQGTTGSLPVQAAVQAGVPTHFIGYCLRKNYVVTA